MPLDYGIEPNQKMMSRTLEDLNYMNQAVLTTEKFRNHIDRITMD